jgi:hypothetical protein
MPENRPAQGAPDTLGPRRQGPIVAGLNAPAVPDENGHFYLALTFSLLGLLRRRLFARLRLQLP